MLRSAYGKGWHCLASGRTLLFIRSLKLGLLCLVWFLLQSFLPGESQVVNLSFKEASLQKVFAEIRKQTGYTFVYAEADLARAKPVSINVSNTRILDALFMIFAGQPFSFTVIERVITIKLKAEKKISREQSSFEVLATIDVRGRVLNQQGDPVAGVTVQVKGNKNIGTYTDEEGEFSLNKIESMAVLVISGVNIQSMEISLNGRSVLDIRVKGKTGKLDEVQVIAYGKTSQRFTTGNQTTIKAEEIERQPVNNPLLALTGRVPGLVVSQANGVPGGGITIRIQGRNNLDNTFVGSDPFIVIDGVPYASQNLSTFKGGYFQAPSILGSSSNDAENSPTYYGNPLAFINPAEIESITVLRDADATAIYGSRAANGAILITTKKGRPGTMKTDINLQQGWGTVPKKMELLDSRQYMEMRREAKRNDGRPVNSTDFDLRGVWDTTRYTDWQDVLIGGTAAYTRLTAGVSGGTNNLQYLVSSTYGRESSVFPGNFANTFGSLHFNLAVTSANQRFKLQLGGSYMANTNNLPAEDFTSYALNLPPVAPALYNPDGSLNWAIDPSTGNSTWWNPLSKQYKLFETKTNNLVSNGSLSYRILQGLELKTTFGFTSTTSDQFIALLDESEKPESRETRLRNAEFSFSTSRTWIVEPQVIFTQKWGNHRLSLLAGASFQYQNNIGRGFIASGHTSDLLLRNMLGGTRLGAAGVDINEYKYNALFGRIGYIFRNRYLINISARRDGSSRFGPQSQFANFGAVGVGWILSEEPFWQRSLRFISFVKLRSSYGTTGNDQIGNYRFLNLYQSSYNGIPYQGVGVSSPLGLPNPTLEWEETRKLQGGIDLGFLKDRLLVTVNYFRNRTSNNLTTVNMPLITGFGSLIANLPALIQNTGWELMINSTNIGTSSIRWSSSCNLTIPRNKLVSFPGLETSPLKNYMKIGQPLSTLATFPFYGIDPLTGAYLVANKNGEPTRAPGIDDVTAFLNMAPSWYGGIQNSLSYKGISIDFLFQFTKQKGMDVNQLANYPGYFASQEAFYTFGNQPVAVMDRWQKPGDLHNYQRFFTTGAPTAGSRGYGDISFLRMKNLSISYELPAELIKKISLNKLRLYANAQNLFTVSRYKGLDPETRSISNLPPLRMMAFGLQATL